MTIKINEKQIYRVMYEDFNLTQLRTRLNHVDSEIFMYKQRIESELQRREVILELLQEKQQNEN
jgi:hypothetical protein